MSTPLLDILHQDSMGIFFWAEGHGQYYKKYIVEFYPIGETKSLFQRELIQDELILKGIWGNEL